MLGWAWFVVVQLIMFVFLLLGLVVLIYPCCKQAWEPSPTPSIKDGRKIDRWRSRILGFAFDNVEDGVSGQTALIWLNPETQAPFMPNAAPSWRAYRWSALRNSAGGLKQLFAWADGPYTEFRFMGRTWRVGWYEEAGRKVPVL